jgi:hypothetical protein
MALYRADVDAPTYYPTAELFVVPGDVVDLNPADAIGLNGLTFIAANHEALETPVSVPEPDVAVDTTEAPAPVVDVPVASEDTLVETPTETDANNG